VGPVGEPLNVIISALSSPQVLTDAGFLNFARAIGLQVIYYSTSWHLLINRFTSSTECFGIHIGDPQSANLGDGHGWFNQTNELREDYGNPDVGTCLESLIGGNHFRSVYPFLSPIIISWFLNCGFSWRLQYLSPRWSVSG
jgi:hypothetical protein